MRCKICGKKFVETELGFEWDFNLRMVIPSCECQSGKLEENFAEYLIENCDEISDLNKEKRWES